MNTLFKNIKSIQIIVGTTLLIVLSLILFCVWPLLSDIQSNSQNLVSAKNSLTALQLQNSDILNFKKNYSDYKPNLDKITASFVDPKNPVDFIKFIEDTAQTAGVSPKISLFSSGQEQDQDPNSIMFQVSASANFLNILHFTEKLEDGPYLIEIENATMKSAEQDTALKNVSLGNVDASFLLKAFGNNATVQ